MSGVYRSQYPKALGATVGELKEVLPPTAKVLAKTRFSMITPETISWMKEREHIKQVRLELRKCTSACSEYVYDRRSCACYLSRPQPGRRRQGEKGRRGPAVAGAAAQPLP